MLIGEFPRECRVESKRTGQLQFDVVSAAVHRYGANEHGGGVRVGAVGPLHSSDRKEHRFDPAGGRKFDILVVDANRRVTSAVKGYVIAHEVAQESRVSCKEAGESTGVPGAQFDRRVCGEVQKRVHAAQANELASPRFPDGFGDVGDDRVGRSGAQTCGVNERI